MDKKELNEIVEAWIAGYENSEGDGEEHKWAIDKVNFWRYDQESQRLWDFILTTYPRELSARATSILAAGPLEDLLADFGPNYIDEIETLAIKDPKFRHLLGGVWRNSITEEVWERVTKARGEVW